MIRVVFRLARQAIGAGVYCLKETLPNTAATAMSGEMGDELQRERDKSSLHFFQQFFQNHRRALGSLRCPSKRWRYVVASGRSSYPQSSDGPWTSRYSDPHSDSASFTVELPSIVDVRLAEGKFFCFGRIKKKDSNLTRIECWQSWIASFKILYIIAGNPFFLTTLVGSSIDFLKKGIWVNSYLSNPLKVLKNWGFWNTPWL